MLELLFLDVNNGGFCKGLKYFTLQQNYSTGMKQIYLPIILFLFIIAGCSAKRTKLNKNKRHQVKLELLGQVAIPYSYTFQQTIVGGLSGLAYDAASKQFYVISDDRSQKSNARFYTIKVQLTENNLLKEGGINFTGVSVLKTPDKKPYKMGTIDAEGIALDTDRLIYVSSEGNPRKNIAPFINGYNKDGRFARRLTIPDTFWKPTNNPNRTQGIRTNLAFETLTTSPNGKILYTATENALIQDGAAADSTHQSPSRIIVYNLSTGDILHEYLYNVDSIYVAPGPRDSFAVNGLTDLAAIDNQGHLLAIERNFVAGQGNHITLYKVSVNEATDIKNVHSIKKYDRPIEPVHKKLIAYLNDFNIKIDNFEGIALGPKIADDKRLLLMVSDNNFSSTQQTLFTAFSFCTKL